MWHNLSLCFLFSVIVTLTYILVSKTRAMNRICEAFQFQGVCRACDSETKSVAVTSSLPPRYFIVHCICICICVWQGAGPLSPGWSVHLLLISRDAAIKPHLTSAGFVDPQPHQPVVGVISSVNLFCTVNSIFVSYAWIAFAHNRTTIPPRRCCLGPSLSHFYLGHTTLVICPSCSLMLPFKIIHLNLPLSVYSV